MTQNSGSESSLKIEWRDMITLDNIRDPELAAKTEQALDAIAATQPGQITLKSIMGNLASEKFLDGRFQGEMVTVSKIQDGVALGGYDTENEYPNIEVGVLLNPEAMSAIRFTSVDGTVITPSFESVLLHELGHIADADMQEELYAIQKKINGTSSTLDKTKDQYIDAALDTTSQFHNTLPDDIEKSVAIIKNYPQLTSSVSEQAYNGALADVSKYIGNRPEILQLTEQLEVLESQKFDTKYKMESSAINVANAYRVIKSETLRGHYDSRFLPGDTPTLETRAKHRILNKGWEEKYGIQRAPTIPDEATGRYNIENELEERINGQLNDILPSHLRNTLPVENTGADIQRNASLPTNTPELTTKTL